MSDQIICEICNFPKPQADNQQTQAIKGQETEEDQGLLDDFQRAYHKVDAAVVYILGYKTEGGITRKQIDVFGAINGLHLRSMPDRRYRNPMLVGAGANFVAVVDRFKDVDVIRITDPLFGLEENDYDELGVPKEEIDLEQIEDLARVTAPSGSRVTGVTILPRGILVANITKEDGVPRYIKVDVEALKTGETQPGFNGVDILEDPFDTFGDMVGAPAPYDIALGPRMYLFATIVSDGDQKHGVALVDVMQGTVKAYVGLPGKYKPISLAHGQGVLNVLVQDPDSEVKPGKSKLDPPFGHKVLRIPVVYGNYMLSGGIENDEMILEPEDFEVNQTYQARDAVGETDLNVPAYLEGARQLNSNYDDSVVGPPIDPEDVKPVGVRWEGSDTASSQALVPRSQEVEEDASMPTYSDERSVPVRVIALPEDRRIYSLGAISNTLIEAGYEPEMEDDRATGKPNNLKSYFFVLHNSHYDYLSDGGFIFGCTKEVPKLDGEGNQVYENGEPVTEIKTNVLLGNDFTPMAMAYDNIVASGETKALPDMGVILVDEKTERIIYRHPKVLGVRCYAGEFASIKYAEENGVKRSLCSDDADKLAMQMDGIIRPLAKDGLRKPERDPEPIKKPGFADDYYPTETFGNEHEYDEPWELLDRRVAPGRDKALVQLEHKSWSMREVDPFSMNKPPLLPEWRDGLIFDLKNPVTVEKGSDDGETFWDKGNDTTLDPKFIATASGGFWFLGLKKERTRLKDELKLDVQDLRDEIDALEKKIDTLEDKIQEGVDDEEKATIEAEIDRLDAEIVSKKAQIEAKLRQIEGMRDDDYETNPVMFVTPRNILKKVYKLDHHVGQDIDVRTSKPSIKAVSPQSADTWDSCDVKVTTTDLETGEEETKTSHSGIVIDPGIRSWIGLDITCNYWGVVTDGVSLYAHDQAHENGLGRVSGSSLYLQHFDESYNPFGRYPGNEYEAGYTCSDYGDGSMGQFEVQVEFNGKPVKKIATRATFLEQIMYMAPEELKDKLYYDMTINTPSMDNGFHRAKVFFSDEIIKEVKVRVRLINYAFEVFRFGWNTVEIFHDWRPTCPGYDPGFWAGDDCEGMACGNVQCMSKLFGGNHMLRPGDPIYPITKQLVWEGEATYTIEDEDNPFLQKGLQVGYFMDCYFNFDLMAPMNAYRVDISENTYRGGGGGHNLSW